MPVQPTGFINTLATHVQYNAGWSPDRPATAYVCQNFTCKAPTIDPEKLKAALKEPSQPVSTSARPVTEQIDLGSLSTKAGKESA